MFPCTCTLEEEIFPEVRAVKKRKKKGKRMKKVKEFFATITETVNVTKLDALLIVTISTLVGMLIGMLCLPKKHQVIGCNNGNYLLEDESVAEEDWEEKDCIRFK